MSAEAPKKSALWANLIRQMDANMEISGKSPQEVLQYVTATGFYTFAQKVGGPQYEVIVADYLAWLDENGTPLHSMPENLRESALVHPDLVESRNGRAISTMFLFHLCIAQRLARYLPAKPRILEIGGGYGGLARVARLLWPDCQYTIVDLEDSLRFSRLFLGENFPEAASLAPGSELPRPAGGFFEFVPADMLDSVAGREFDIVLNTCSFGEMTQATVDAYHDLIENRIDVPLWYSINRFGRRPFGDLEYQAPREAGEDTAYMTLFPSPAWDVLVWDCWNETGFAEIEICAAPYLEVFLTRGEAHKRGPSEQTTEWPAGWFHRGWPPSFDAEQGREKAAWLLHAARNLTPNTSAWHYGYFNALRYYPTRDVLDHYRRVIEEANWPEAEFFARLAVHSEKSPEADLTAPLPAPVRKVLFQNLEFTRLTRTSTHRSIQRLQQLRAEEEKHKATIVHLFDRDRHIREVTGALNHLEELRSKELAHSRELEQEIDRLKRPQEAER